MISFSKLRGNFIQKQTIHSLLIMKLRATSLVTKFIFTLFIARFMDFEVLGLYGLIASASMVVPSFVGLSLMYTLTRKAVTQTSDEITEMLIYYGRFICLIYFLLLIGVLVYGILFKELFLSVIIIFVILFEHVNNDFYNLLLNLAKPFSANFLHFIRSAAWMVLFMGISFLFPFFRTVEFLLIGWMIGGFFSLIGFFWVTRKWPWSIKRPLEPLGIWIRNEFRETKVVYVTNFIRTSNQYLNHFLVTIFLGIELTGVYVFFMQVLGALSNLLQTGVIQIARPKMVRSFKEKSKDYLALYRKCFKETMFIATAMAMFAGPSMYIITFYIVDKPLAKEWFPIFWMVLILFMLSAISEVNRLIFYSQHRDDLILKLSIISIPIGVALTFILIPTIGLWGAVLAPIILGFFGLILQFQYVKNIL